MLKVTISPILAGNYGVKSYPIVLLICIYGLLVSWRIFKVLKVWNFISVTSHSFAYNLLGFKYFLK